MRRKIKHFLISFLICQSARNVNNHRTFCHYFNTDVKLNLHADLIVIVITSLKTGIIKSIFHLSNSLSVGLEFGELCAFTSGFASGTDFLPSVGTS